MKQRFSSQSFSATIYKEQKEIYLFCKADVILDCQNIHNTIFETIQENETYKDITLQDVCDYAIQVFLDSILLTGGTESNKPYNECFFGELDSKNTMGLDDTKPIYHLIGETDYDSKDSKERFTQTLQVFLGSNTLTLLNYSLLDSSLNIKLECTSSESKAIQEREQTQRKQKEQDSKTQDSPQSTALLHPILEDNEIKCPHNGVVKLKSNKGKSFTSKGIPMVLESDLLNASIIGCANNILTLDSKTFSTNQYIIPKNKAINAS